MVVVVALYCVIERIAVDAVLYAKGDLCAFLGLRTKPPLALAAVRSTPFRSPRPLGQGPSSSESDAGSQSGLYYALASGHSVLPLFPHLFPQHYNSPEQGRIGHGQG